MNAGIFIVLCCAAVASAQHHIVIVAGQSNCSSADASEVGPPWSEPLPAIHYAYHVNVHVGEVGPLRPQANADTMGPELAMGYALHAARPGVPFAIFKESKAGSPMAYSATKLDWNVRSKDEMLDQFLADIAAFREEVPGEVRAVLLVHGEGDSYTGRAATYGQRLVEFDAVLAAAWPEDPVLVPCLMAPESPAYTAVPERIQSTLDWGYDWSVPMIDFELKPDQIHLTNRAQLLFGKRLAAWVIDNLYPCRADWQGDGEVNTRDIIDFLNAWASGDADFNADGVTDSRDVVDLLYTWSGGC